MARYLVDAFTTASVPANSILEFSRDLSSYSVNFVKIKIEPSANDHPAELRIFSKDDYDPAYMVYATLPFIADYIDPISDDEFTLTEVNEGFILPYEEANGNDKAYFRIYNDSDSPRTFDVTIVYEVATAVNPRDPLTGLLFTDFSDTDLWVPTYAAAYINTSFTGAGGIRWSSKGLDYNLDDWSVGIRSRFYVYPDSNGELQYRIKYENCHFHGTGYASCTMSSVLRHTCGRYDCGPGMGVNGSTANNQIFISTQNDGSSVYYFNRDTNYSVTLGIINPCSVELIMTIGMCARTSGGTKNGEWGLVGPSCTYSYNGGAHTALATTTSYPYQGDYAQNLSHQGVGVCTRWTGGITAEQEMTLTEIEILKGVILKAT